ncbi:MAG: hypothetical protein GY886_12885, partial [Gammaproteobacteria bacterium]|nr:hypothetical protein [Gammaproteobacteria bacterium]
MNFVAALKFLAVIFIVLFIQACAVSRTVTYDKVEIEAATTEIPDYALLDVGIVLFDPGIPESQEEQQKDLVFPEVRRAEARYIPYHLKGTLESTGYWGSVWVLPEE